MQSELFPLADRAVVGSHTAVVLFEIHQIVYISSDQGNIFGIFAGAAFRKRTCIGADHLPYVLAEKVMYDNQEVNLINYHFPKIYR